MKLLSQTVQFDTDLLQKYDQPLPRYTSYPPATELTADFDESYFRAAIALGNLKKTTAFALLSHSVLRNPLLLLRVQHNYYPAEKTLPILIWSMFHAIFNKFLP
ncbi:hypothetical protein [Neosynechococcus sphagnicola]|uniref:hypothetical protein n=1 Tax=Neosynechococcus sphagnicola TaxID=1501145 RepID=UPI000ADADEAE